MVTPRARPLRLRAAIAPSALLLALAPSCHGESDAAATGGDEEASLEASFPGRSSAVLHAGAGFIRTAAGFAPAAPTARLSVELPATAGDVVLRDGPRGLVIRESGITGKARAVGNAVAYERADGVSFWTTTAGGAEEWLRFEPGAIRAGAPAATWKIAGATAVQRGRAIELARAGAPSVWMTAPAAFAEGGASVAARLQARGAEVELFVDAGGRGVLVDPVWTTVGPLPTVLENQAAATLANGKVLVAGGNDGVSYALAISALYDPTTTLWTATSGLLVPRSFHTASPLADGTALVAGGESGFESYLNEAEIFDPTTGAWTAVSTPMASPHSAHTASVLKSGQVLLAGGRTAVSGSVVAIDNVDLYDPTLGMGGGWGAPTYMNQPRYDHAATVLADGTVLVTGGAALPGFVLNAVEIYDPTSGQWSSPATSLVSPRENHQSILLADGTVLITGGDDGNNALITTEIYDPTAQSFNSAAPMSTPRVGHQMAAIPNGMVIVVGGSDGVQSLSSTEIFDPTSGTWSAGPSMNEARTAFTLSPVGQDLLAAGGYDSTTDAVIATSELLSFAAPQGAPCTTGTGCGTGFCASGVCCDQVCTGTCMACSVALKGSGVDGTCGPAAAGTNPGMLCVDQGANSCGTTAACDGNGACATYADGTPCTGTGTCAAGNCSGGTCVATLAAAGAACTSDSCCGSGHCVSGVCCDTACTGACVACTAKLKGSGVDGTCGPTPAGSNPGKQCMDEGATTCGTTGACNGMGACAVYADGTSCSDSACATGECEKGACTAVHKLDGTSCPDGICIAGECTPDPKLIEASSSSSSTGTFATSGAGGSAAVTSGAGGGTGGGTAAAKLHGGGCSTSAPASTDPWSMVAGATAVAAWARRRRRERGGGGG